MATNAIMVMLSEWFGIVGIDPAFPIVDLATLIPYLLQVCLAIVLTGLVFGAVVSIAKMFTDWRFR